MIPSQGVSRCLGEISAAGLTDSVVMVGPDTGRISYRFKACTELATVGINHSLGEQRSIDFSWRRATVKPARALGYFGATQAKYLDDQISLSYLMRF